MLVRTDRFWGGVLLVAGTSIGAGMLVLPVSTGFSGFVPSFLLLFLCWLFMLVTAFLFLEVNLSIKGQINLVTMASVTLGNPGKIFSWVIYLLLLYSLTAAYIAASSSMFLSVLNYIFTADLPSWVGPFPLLLFFGFIIYLGTKTIDHLNRVLMLGLVITYLILIFFLPSHVQYDLLKRVDWNASIISIPLIITSFGFHIIIPTLTNYLHHRPSQLRWMLVVGSAIPFIVYSLWEFLALGTVPLIGEESLVNAYEKGESVGIPLTYWVKNSSFALAIPFFSFFAVITSFLGVTTSLSDFLRDGFKLKNTGSGKVIACILTFIPPLVFVLTDPRGFYVALEYAGAFVALLLGVLPALMAWRLYKSFYGRCLLVTVILISLFIVVVDCLGHFGVLKPLIRAYVHV